MKNLNVQGSCEKQLEGLADRKFQSSYFKLAVKDEYIKKIKDYFCVTYPGVGFCPATPSPAPQQAAPQGPPQLTPEQIQQQQMMIQQQHMMQQQQQALSMLTTPSGFIGNNPGISIGLAVILISGFCFFAAFAISFLTAKNQKPTVNKGRPQNRARRQSKNGNKPKKGRSSCAREQTLM
ncbi:hypothetical protein GCK72_009925 [Caenorhabditis remanei]|uniref:Uncharacterized protein n=1 Tax=Caenorhabditis remanei TaxID=31234 RepID=A0A6A5H3U8_CAERE|nr:hypothetical protein GCK72_009925 [Caenorhabditis remanei]KAF1761669.1 hypothetical protein GCK72_009925 [Caenorhabditis remanei]